MTRTIAACALALGLGFAAARLTQPAPPAPPTPSSPSRAEPSAHAAAPQPREDRAAARADLDSAALRAVIRETLRQELAELERAEGAEGASPATATEPPTAAQDEAYDRGASILESARTSRQWRAADRHAMLGALAAMSIPQREQLLSQLFMMLNRGELRPVQGTPPI